ncbi:hypothetical protein, unknown function [Leishmania tarentolae]|uniref:Uncharacterized protein n=1 Tax=Leishmania tarentolae TaxID=5689 RepID=A0A640KUX8_LEITA|nr:hypothetical protein, unknown function [Leishmania tarentolae]
MGYNDNKRPMPQLRLPADYVYNPLYFVPQSKATPKGCIDEDDGVKSLQCLEDAVLPATTYLHRPLHFSPSSSNATPVRGHGNRARSGESRRTCTSGNSSLVATSSRQQRSSSSVAAVHASLRKRGHALTQEVAAWQRRSGTDYVGELSLTAAPEEVTVDSTNADLSTILRPTRATQLREEYVLHYMEERDEAAQNIFFRPKGWPLPGAALSSPCRQHRTSSASPSRNGFLTPTRPGNSSVAYLPAPRFTKAAQLRQQSTVQLMEKLARWELEKAAEEALAQLVAEAGSRRALLRLRAGARSNSSSTVFAGQQSSSVRGANAPTPFNDTHSSHHMRRCHRTPRSGSFGDAVNGVGQHIRATARSVSAHAGPREQRRPAASNFYDGQAKPLKKTENVAEAAHAPSNCPLLDAPAPLPRSKYRPLKSRKEEPRVPRGELSTAMPNETMVALSEPASRDGGERVPSPHHGFRSCLHAANLDSENLSPLAIRNVCGAAHCAPTTSAVASPAAAVPQKSEQRVLASGGHAPLPSSKHAILTVSAVRDIESTMALNEHIPLAQRSASSTSSQQRDGGESSSSFVSSIMFTVLSAPQEDIADVHAPPTQCDSHEVVTKATQRREICDDADDSSVEFQSTGRGDWKQSASLSASLAAVSAARPYVVRSAELSPVASPNLSCVPSPTHTSTSVASDEVPMSAATTALPQKQKTESSCSEEEVERIRHTLRVHECRAPRRLLEQVSEGLAQEPSAHLSERFLERRGDHPPPGDAYETLAHAHQTPATQHADDVGWGSLSRDSHLRDSSMSSSSGEAEAQRPSWSESTDWSARVSATPPQQPAGNEVAEGDVGNMMTDAEEQWDEGSVVSTQSSFTSIASYHTEVHVRVLAVQSEAVNEALEAGTSQTEPLAHCSTAKSSSAAFESRIDHRAVHNRCLKSGAPAVSHGGEASRAADETQALRGDSSAARSSPSWLWNASEGITFGLCGFAPSTASGESDASRSVVTDACTVVAGGGCSVFPSWGLPVPRTNCTHMTAAKEARQQTSIEAGLTKWCTTLEQPSRLSVDHISESRVRQPTVADVGSMLRHLPQTEVAVKKEALDSLRLPQLQESGCCTSAPPVAERPPNNAVAESTETATKGNLRPEVVPDKARALAHEKTIDDAPDVAVPLSTVVGLCTGARWDADYSSVQGEAVHRRGANQFLKGVMAAAAPEQSSLYWAGAQQPTATKNAAAVPLSVTDAPSSRAVFSRSSCVAIGREDRASEKVRGDRPAKMGGAPPSNDATVTRSVRGADDSVSDGTAGAQTAILASPPHALADTHAEAAVKKAIDPPDAVVLYDGLETALVARSSNSRSVTSPVRESAQPEEASAIPLNTTFVHSEDTTSHLSRCSSAEVGGADRAQHMAAVSVKTSLPLSAWPRALELASTPGSIMAAEHGSLSVHFTEAEQSPRERSVYTRQAASFSNSGGEEELGEGGPHSHAPTPPQYRLPQQRNQETPPYEVVLLPGASAAEERNSDATVAVTFSRSDASTRCLCASPDELPTGLSVLGLTSGKAEGTPAMPYGAASSGFSAVEEQSRVECDRAAAAPSRHTLDSSAPPSVDVTLELEAVPAQCAHDSPAGVLSSWTSSSTEFVARSPSSSPLHSSSSSAAPMATGRLMPMPLEELDASRRGDGGKVDFQLIADSDCDNLLTGDAVEVSRNIFSSTTSCDSLPNAAEVKPTEPASTDAAVMITPCRPRSPFPGSDFNTSCSQVSERITWSVGAWVDRERASASPDHAETCAAESDLGVLSRGTLSAPTVPLMQVKYLNQDM